MGDVLDATELAISRASHLTPADAGALEALRAVARKIDVADEYFRLLEEWSADTKGRPVSPDNVSLPTYLKYAESLGLTPVGRGKLKPEAPAPRVSKLGELRAAGKPGARSA